MKKLLSLFVLIFMGLLVFSQAPQKFSYQAVVRDAGNNLITNHAVGVQISILQGGVNGSTVYMESQTAVTNANGLMTLQIGGGTMLSGDFATIDWANGPYFLKTETDPNGGSNYTIMGTQQLLSVPYALYAGNAANSFSGSYNDLTDLPQMPDIPTNVSAFNNDAGYITMDSIPEIPMVPTQVSAFENDANYLTSYTETDPQFNAWNKDYNDLTNKPTIPDIPTNVSVFTNDAGYITMDSVPTIPVNVSAFTNNVGYLVSADLQTIQNNIVALQTDTIQTLREEMSNLMDSIRVLQQNLNDLAALVSVLNVQMEQELLMVTAGQASFTLQHAPKPTCIIRCYINGVMVGSNRSGLIEIDEGNPQQLNYVASFNRNYTLKANDKVTFVYWY